jgi:hypothetical protein
MNLQITFDNGTVMNLEGVKTFGFDAKDSTVQDITTVSHPEFIPEFIKKNIENNKLNN